MHFLKLINYPEVTELNLRDLKNIISRCGTQRMADSVFSQTWSRTLYG